MKSVTTEGTPAVSSTRPLASDFDFSRWRDLPLPDANLAPEQKNLYSVGAIERVAAIAGLVALTPLMLLVAAAIKVESPRAPVIYRQERVGCDRRSTKSNGPFTGTEKDRRRTPRAGQPFSLLKFRTMVPDAEAKSGPTWASDNDPRITRLGRVLRKSRLDELPQLLNVATGQMRLIGPRPERPFFVDQFVTDIPEYSDRLRVPPGITGLAQVEREYDADVSDVRTKLKYDLFYARNRSPRLDLKILIKTVDVVLRGKGAK